MSPRSKASEPRPRTTASQFPYGGIEALTESTGDGCTIHGDFLFAEVVDGDETGQRPFDDEERAGFEPAGP